MSEIDTVLLEMEQADRERPLTITIGRIEMFCVFAAVQLACRHPGFSGRSRKIVEGAMRQIQEQFPPRARAVMEKGWDPGQDEITTQM